MLYAGSCMGKMPLSLEEVSKIIELRKTGHSIPEIQKIICRGKTTVFNYIKNVEVLPEYKEILRVKQGGSKCRSKRYWDIARVKAKELMPTLCFSNKLIILACLYWGEGNKKDLNLVNSDPGLIKVFVDCLLEIGVKKDDLRITLRLFDDLSESECVEYWARVLDVDIKAIRNVNFIKGNKVGKLKYGMCRVRVRKSHEYFKLIISVIDLLRFSFSAPVVQWIRTDSS